MTQPPDGNPDLLAALARGGSPSVGVRDRDERCQGQILMKQGDYSTELIAIEEGSADVIQNGIKIASLKQGDLIGEMGLLLREPRNADVIATSPMRLLKLTHWEVRRMSDETVERIKQIIAERQRSGLADPAHSVPRRRPATVSLRTGSGQSGE